MKMCVLERNNAVTVREKNTGNQREVQAPLLLGGVQLYIVRKSMHLLWPQRTIFFYWPSKHFSRCLQDNNRALILTLLSSSGPGNKETGYDKSILPRSQSFTFPQHLLSVRACSQFQMTADAIWFRVVMQS